MTTLLGFNALALICAAAEIRQEAAWWTLGFLAVANACVLLNRIAQQAKEEE